MQLVELRGVDVVVRVGVEPQLGEGVGERRPDLTRAVLIEVVKPIHLVGLSEGKRRGVGGAGGGWGWKAVDLVWSGLVWSGLISPPLARVA